MYHKAIKTTHHKPAQHIIFRGGNSLLGRLKRASDASGHAMRPPYVATRLAFVQFRFNPRFDLQ